MLGERESREHGQGHCIPDQMRLAQSIEKMPPDLEDGCDENKTDPRSSLWGAGAGEPG
jgi:hypothetical protein